MIFEEVLKEVNEELKKYTDEFSYFYTYTYLKKANLLFLTGASLDDVFQNFWNSSKCFFENGKLHLYKTAIKEFRKRRLDPIEVSIVGGDTKIMSQNANFFGLSINPLLVGLGEPSVMKEADTITNYFKNRKCSDIKDYAGFSALCYCSAISSMLAGFQDEAKGALFIYKEEKKRFSQKEKPLIVLKYELLNELLDSLVENDDKRSETAINDLIKLSLKMMDKKVLLKENIHNFLDRPVLAMLGMLVLKGVKVEIDTESIYSEIFKYMLKDEVSETSDKRMELTKRLIDNLT